MTDIGIGNAATVTNARVDAQLEKLRTTAGQVVGSVFYGTLLKELRQSSLKGDLGHGGRGEEVFQAQLDQIYAEQVGKSSRFDLVDSIYKSFEKKVQSNASAGMSGGGA